MRLSLRFYGSALLLFLTTPSAALADNEPAHAQNRATVTEPAPPTAAATTSPAAEPAVAARATVCACGTAKLPLYVQDWQRLADLTHEDPSVFAKADFWRTRQESSRWIVGGIIAGAGVATLATFDRLSTGSWSEGNKWTLVGGLTAVAVSTLAYLAFSPDRDDLLSVLNQWNLRHPDRPLAP